MIVRLGKASNHRFRETRAADLDISTLIWTTVHMYMTMQILGGVGSDKNFHNSGENIVRGETISKILGGGGGGGKGGS